MTRSICRPTTRTSGEKSIAPVSGMMRRIGPRIGSSSERVMSMQQEYGEMAREQVRANPLAALVRMTGLRADEPGEGQGHDHEQCWPTAPWLPAGGVEPGVR